MVKICPQLEAHGACTNPLCKGYHDVHLCELCGVFCASTKWYESHLASKKHRRKLSGHDGHQYHCTICDTSVSGHRSWVQHVQGQRHRTNAQNQGVLPEVAPAVPEALPGKVLCGVCDKQIPEGLWASHPQSAEHRRREGYTAFKTALEEAEKDKHGVVLSEGLDFGILENADAARGASRTLTVETTVPSSRVTIKKVSLSSSFVGGKSPFAITTTAEGAVLGYRRPTAIGVRFSTPHSGRMDDRLEILFEDTALRVTFVIARTLKAIVGSQADHELLKPIAPFQPRQRTRAQPEKEVVPGVPPPSKTIIPYTVNLPPAKISESLLAALSETSTGKALDHIRRVFLPRVIDSSTYSRYFKTLLWIEEYRMEHDLGHYDIPDAQLEHHRPYYYVKVPGLAEKRPSVLIGDRFLVQKHGAVEGHWYEGHVHFVQQESVGLRFDRSFGGWSEQQRYTVRFKLNRIPMRRQHQALDTAFASDKFLFPQKAHILPLAPRPGVGPIMPFNSLIATNPPQLQAVTSILLQQSGSAPFAVFGPPGTGKTITIVEAMKQLLKHKPNTRILATAPSNSAADIIASRLASTLGPDELFRLYAPSRDFEQVPDELRRYTHRKTLEGQDKGCFSVPPIPILKRYKVIVCTCVSASIPYGIGIPRGHFTHIFVDEAGQATEPEVMIGIKTMADNATNIVLAGDPKQLGPIIRSNIARELGLERSYLERLMSMNAYEAQSGHGLSVVKLVKNFRSHPAILKFPNERFYANDLESCGNKNIIRAFEGWNKLPSKKFPIIFHSISGKDDREASSPSFFNIDEVTQVRKYIDQLRDDRQVRVAHNEIGVITPYHAQCVKIRKRLSGVADEVKVGSVEEFQGQERRVIIISTVRSSRDFVAFDLKHTLGFVANPRRFNVAVTRAQALLIVVGDPNVLSLDPLWRSFLNYVHLNGGWAGPGPTWDTTETVDESGEYDQHVRAAALTDMNLLARRIEEVVAENVQTNEGDDDDDDDDDANSDRPWRELE
ncbi:RNA helicase [Suillus clintonianus]|uniref:RNA helicase n=1 Tax=Suillus clintonianus TaxID=1904413 RepID=UPI001B879C9A|nr:RNA helicase [Suillus clintonianus]KAG2145172.1 RNA helicase [Suillus clintonianus]